MRAAAAVLIITLAVAAPAYAQSTEVAFAPTAAMAHVNGDLNYTVRGVNVEAARYVWHDVVAVTGEVAYATGSGTLIGQQREIGISITTAMVGVRGRLPTIGRFESSIRTAMGRSLIVFDYRDGPSHDAPVNNTFAAVVGGSIDYVISPRVALRIQPDLFYRGACPGGPSGRDGWQVRLGVGGVFAW